MSKSRPNMATTDRELIDNLQQWVYHILNRLDQIENPGIEQRWPEPGEGDK